MARVLAAGHRTPDLGGTAGTSDIGDRVVDVILSRGDGEGSVWVVSRQPPIPILRSAQDDSKTLLDKLWDAHVVHQPSDGPPLLYIDLHLVHEVTSPQAFDGLREAGRRVRRPDRTFATVDHNVPTTSPRRVIADPVSAKQIDVLRANCAEFGITLYDIDSAQQGIVHVIGPELGLTQPGMTIVCGDSHTSTHGAFGALAFGIGTSDVEHVLATQCLRLAKP